MLPYNRKLWARDLKRISTEWTSQRVAAPKGTPERFLTSGGERKPLQSDSEVGYPPEGGYEEIYLAFLNLEDVPRSVGLADQVALPCGQIRRWRCPCSNSCSR